MPAGDQPRAIEAITEFLSEGARHATLLGVTGSGKTFTMANVIKNIKRPTLVISHNKTLAAQLYQELKEFFPQNAVHYFVSYYDYYQPEAYIPQTDTYIEKDAKINDLIDSLRHAATASILSRPDTIVVASVSCIYGLGNPEEYERASTRIMVGEKLAPKELAKHLTLLQYNRNSIDPRRGEFRMRGDLIEITSPSNEEIIRVEFEKNAVTAISTRRPWIESSPRIIPSFKIFPAKHFVPPQKKLALALSNIKKELKKRLAYFKNAEKPLEAERIAQKTRYDLEMIKEMGYAPGIENYSRHLDFRSPGEPPFTLLDYFRYARRSIGEGEDAHPDFLTIIDESHATVPQIRGMYAGDRSRKETLIEYGFRLPSALDNRPLRFEEFKEKVGQILYVSATPAEYELAKSGPHIAEQVIRPTGLLDPALEVRPTKDQIKDVIAEIQKRVERKERSLVLALTKRMAEDIAEYLKENGIKTEYLHSDIKTLDRPEILKNLRLGPAEGGIDALVGINLLREGLDLPEVSFIAILDADKEGFLRNDTTLLQIIGRAARHINGRVVLYADTVTGSMKRAMAITEQRRQLQADYNATHGITPQQIKKGIKKTLLEDIGESPDMIQERTQRGHNAQSQKPLTPFTKQKLIQSLELEMKKAAKDMDFELAAKIRDRIEQCKKRNSS